MRNFPRYINSRADIDHLAVEYPEKLKAFLQELVDTKDEWILTGKLEDWDAGITDATHKVVENKDQETGEIKDRYQFEFMEDPNGPIFRYGFESVAEVQAIIDSLE